MKAGKVKVPPPFEGRRFALVPKSVGAGYQVAELLGAAENAPDEVRVCRWDSAARDFKSPGRIKRAQVIGDVPDGDRRLVDIAAHIAKAIAEAEKKNAEAEAKKAS